MFEREQALALAEQALKACGNDIQAEAILLAKRVGATRFSGNAITQNMDEETNNLRLRVIDAQGRQGVASGNRFDAAALKALAEKARRAAEHSPADKDLVPLLERQPEYKHVDAFNADTFGTTPRERAERLLDQLTLCRQRDLEGTGLFETGGAAVVYANSKGVKAYHRSTIANLSVSVFSEGGKVEGSAKDVDHNIHSVSVRHVGSTAIERAMNGKGAKGFSPGKIDVVLEKAAVAELLHYLIYLGFATQAHVEQRSSLTGRLGQHLFSEHFTLRSDPYDPRYEGCPFDFEGFPTEAITLVDAGVFKELPHDRRTAAALNARNTGYANPQPDTSGPIPGDLVVKEGVKTREELIASTDRGLLITELHYLNVVDPMALSITGMTRGGVWMIEKGKVTHPVRNLRFTQNLIQALANIDGVENIAEAVGGGLFGGGAIAPAMKIKDFSFSSSTDF